MPLVIIGVLLLAAKFAAVGPVADWSWWWVLSPFAAAAVWWAIADATGITQRRAMQKMEDRKTDRRNRALDDLGLGTRKTGRGSKPGQPMAGRSPAPARPAGTPAGAPKEPRL